MEIAIAGAGYVGLTSAACFCEMGHRVRLVEIDPERLALLLQGSCPIFEPGLPELLKKHLGSSLTVTDRLAEALDGARALFVCVGTPPRPDGAPDLSALKRLLGELRRALGEIAASRTESGRPETVIAMKSTVPPGTCRMVSQFLKSGVAVVSNPEFLREGTAIDDFFHPDRIVVGGPDAGATLVVAGLYRNIDAPLLVTGWEESELVKYATNAFLAIKISFANEIAALCDGLETDAGEVLQGLGLDQRVGPQFLRPGPGYGGSCLPKDLRALAWRAKKAGVRLDLLPAAERVNARQRHRLVAKLTTALGTLSEKTVAMWGLAFKAGTDDLRGAAALEIVPKLLGQGATVQAFDPAAMVGFAHEFPPEEWPGLVLVPDHMEALRDADALLILTEWDLFRSVRCAELAAMMRGRVVVDGRNLLDADEAVRAGLIYRGVGRGRVK